MVILQVKLNVTLHDWVLPLLLGSVTMLLSFIALHIHLLVLRWIDSYSVNVVSTYRQMESKQGMEVALKVCFFFQIRCVLSALLKYVCIMRVVSHDTRDINLMYNIIL